MTLTPSDIIKAELEGSFKPQDTQASSARTLKKDTKSSSSKQKTTGSKGAASSGDAGSGNPPDDRDNSDDPNGQNGEKRNRKPHAQVKCLKFVIWATIVYALVTALGIVLWILEANGDEWMRIHEDIMVGKAIVYLMIIYTLASFWYIPGNKVATHEVLGRPIRDLKPGFVFRPPIFTWLVVFKGTYNQQEIPADPEKIYRGDGNPPEGMYPPLRVTFSGNTAGKSRDTDPLKRRLTEEVAPTVWWIIESPTIFRRKIGTITEAKRQIDDITVHYVTRELTKITLADAMSDLEKQSRNLHDHLHDKTDDWGIGVKVAQIKGFQLSHELNIQIQAGAEAQGRMAGTILDARAERDKRIEEGKGQAEAERAVILGRGEAMQRVAKMLGVRGYQVLAAETARDSLKGPNQKVIVGAGGGLSDLYGVAALLRPESLDNSPQPQSPTDENKEKTTRGERSSKEGPDPTSGIIAKPPPKGEERGGNRKGN